MDVYPIQHNHLIAPLISEKNVPFNSQINKKIDEENLQLFIYNIWLYCVSHISN
jgi:hypothetical protein